MGILSMDNLSWTVLTYAIILTFFLKKNKFDHFAGFLVKVVKQLYVPLSQIETTTSSIGLKIQETITF